MEIVVERLIAISFSLSPNVDRQISAALWRILLPPANGPALLSRLMSMRYSRNQGCNNRNSS
jgi:hypothetical protein